MKVGKVVKICGIAANVKKGGLFVEEVSVLNS